MKKLIVGLAAAVVITGISLLIWWYVAPAGPPPDPEKDPTQTVVSYLASNRFAQLPDPEKARFAEKIDALPENERRDLYDAQGLSDQQKSSVRRNLGTARGALMNQRIHDFFQLSPDEQTATLDKLIDDQEARRANRPQRPPNPSGSSNQPSGNPRPGRRTPDPDRMQARMEHHLSDSTPQQRAEHYAYFHALAQRRAQRGLTGPSFGGR